MCEWGAGVLNVSRGGTLEQHLPDGGHSAAAGTFGSHPVRVAAGSRLASVLGPPDGGGDLDPAGYGAAPHPETTRV